MGRDFRFDGPLLSEAVQRKRLLDKSDVRSLKEGLFHAYVGIGQISNVPKSMQMSRAYVLEKARAANDAEAVKKLDPPPFDSMDKIVLFFRMLPTYGLTPEGGWRTFRSRDTVEIGNSRSKSKKAKGHSKV